MRYYEPEAGRFVNQDLIGLWGENLYWFGPNAQVLVDFLGIAKKHPPARRPGGYRTYDMDFHGRLSPKQIKRALSQSYKYVRELGEL